MEETYNELALLFLRHGYIITSKDGAGMEALHENGISFSQIQGGKYIESSLCLATDELCMIYDILSGEYTTELFNEKENHEQIITAFRLSIMAEINRMQLAKYVR